MKLKSKLYTYISFLHLIIVATSLYFYQELGLIIFIIEVLVILSFLYSLKLVKQALAPLDFTQSFSNILKENEYSARFSPVGQIELDELFKLYNEMLTNLYQERLRVGEQGGIVSRLLESSPSSIIIFDYENRITLVNQAAEKLLHTKQEQLMGKKLQYLNSTTFVHLDKLKINETRLIALNNGERIRIQKSTFKDRGFDRAFIVIEELTNELEKIEKAAYDKLIRIMSHEVNNTIAATNSLLNSCLNYSSQLDVSDQDDYTNAMNVVINRNINLNHFMQGYADVIKLPVPEPHKLDINELMQNVLSIYASQFKERNICCELDVQTDNFDINADSYLLEQVLINIIKNAMEAIDRDGNIQCIIKGCASEVILSVQDTGSGLNDKTLDVLFTPFYTTKGEGQGLGLMLVKEILSAHQFSFSLENVSGSQEGAIFSIHFPI